MAWMRAAEYVDQLRQSDLALGVEELELLQFAIRHHSDGATHPDPTIATCWDADRLDLGRVGIRPDPDRLCTEAARNREVLEWAYRNSGRR